MQDPTHIPPVAALLQRAWEAQPQLGFAEFFARLAARGIARNSSDAELADALRAELSVHPWSFEGGCHGARRWTAHGLGSATTRKRRRVVRPAPSPPAPGSSSSPPGPTPAKFRSDSSRSTRNGSWCVPPRRAIQCSRQCGVTRPSNAAAPANRYGCAVVHRLGIVRLITVLEPAARDSTAELGQESEPDQPDLSGMTFAQWQELGAPEFLLRFDSGATAIVGSALRVTTVTRREVQHSSFPWDAIRAAAIGGPLVVQFPPSVAGGMGAADPTGAASAQPGATGTAGAQPGAMGTFGATRAIGAAPGAAQQISELGTIELCMRI